jgi:uncharacterized membrane protein YgcG
MAWNFRRWLRHELTDASAVNKVLSADAMKRLGALVTAGEKRHSGEIRLVVEASLDLPLFRHGISARERAVSVFSNLRVWDTEANNGVLIYLLLADHDVEIVADRGINEIVGAVGWEAICHAMEQSFRLGNFEAGLEEGLREVAEHLETHFPANGENRNELPDEPLILR